MYRVIKLYGACEPWWFLDGWEKDVVASKSFESYEAAWRFYQKEWVYLSETYPQKKNKTAVMTAFWNPSEKIWCDECDEYLQQYHSILLLEVDEHMPKGLQLKRTMPRLRPCQIKN